MRSNVSKVRLHLTKLLRLREKKHKHYLKILQQLGQISKAIEVYEGALALDKEITGAIPNIRAEGQSGPAGTDTGSGGLELPNNQAVGPVLAEQPTELPSN